MSEKIMIDKYVRREGGKWIQYTVYVEQQSEDYRDDILIFEKEIVYAEI